MIETVNYIANNGILISGIANGKEYDIKFDEIRSYWDYATEDDFEGGTAKPFGDKILFTVLTASSQGGIVVLWDVPKRAIEHISECSYSVAVDIHNNDIYSLHCVSNYNMTANFKLYKS